MLRVLVLGPLAQLGAGRRVVQLPFGPLQQLVVVAGARRQRLADAVDEPPLTLGHVGLGVVELGPGELGAGQRDVDGAAVGGHRHRVGAERGEVDLGVDLAGRHQQRALAGDERRHQVDVLLAVDEHLEVPGRRRVGGEVLHRLEDRRRGTLGGVGPARLERREGEPAGEDEHHCSDQRAGDEPEPTCVRHGHPRYRPRPTRPGRRAAGLTSGQRNRGGPMAKIDRRCNHGPRAQEAGGRLPVRHRRVPGGADRHRGAAGGHDVHRHAQRAVGVLRGAGRVLPDRTAPGLPRRLRSRRDPCLRRPGQRQGELLADDPHRRRLRPEPRRHGGLPGGAPGRAGRALLQAQPPGRGSPPHPVPGRAGGAHLAVRPAGPRLPRHARRRDPRPTSTRTRSSTSGRSCPSRPACRPIPRRCRPPSRRCASRRTPSSSWARAWPGPGPRTSCASSSTGPACRSWPRPWARASCPTSTRCPSAAPAPTPCRTPTRSCCSALA